MSFYLTIANSIARQLWVMAFNSFIVLITLIQFIQLLFYSLSPFILFCEESKYTHSRVTLT